MFPNLQKYSAVWQDCLARIREHTSEDEFSRWFKPIVLLDFDGTTLRLRVPNESYVTHLEKNYIPLLRPLIQNLFGADTKLRYSVPKAGGQTMPVPLDADITAITHFTEQTDTTKIKNPFVIPGLKRIVIDSQLNPANTIESFIEGDCNRLVRSTGISVSLSPGTTPFNPLYIFGGSGLGKTHVAQAVGLEVKRRFPNLQVLYVSMHKFQAQYTTAVLNKEVNDFIHFYQMVDVLIIDDIQELSGKPATQNAFFNIFNHLQLAGKQLILTSDKPPVELRDIEQRLLTRFKWGLSAELAVPDYDTKVKIIRSKTRRLNVDIPDEVVLFLADNIRANVREIEGALASLVANAQFLGRKVTVSLAREILKVYVQVHRKEISIDQIKSVVCEVLGVTPESFSSQRRTREIAQARQIAMYLSKKHTKAPLTAIGAAIGGKNHATVLHSCKQVANLAETDRGFRLQIEEIERRVIGK
jgi:chromosomal replication initiator protein